MKNSLHAWLLFLVLTCVQAIHSADTPPLSCTLRSSPRTSAGHILQFILITNTSSQEISLAAIRVSNTAKTPPLYFDTQPTSVRVGPDLMVPAFYSDTPNSENKPLRFGSDHVKPALQNAQWNPHDIVTVSPGGQIKCLLNGTPPDSPITLHFLRFTKNTFHPLDIALAVPHPTQNNPP
jgi:hypothetical protein